jgi:Mg-chelatase subunit ChlD/LysM repeat protein/type II secretory pathway pseudopilin PulG
MNPEKPSREQIEARITALLLGELPAEEAELLRWTISQDPELQKLHARLLLTVGFVREAMQHPADTEKTASLKLSDERRAKLLAHFKTPRQQPLVPPLPRESIWSRQIGPGRLIEALVVVALIAILAAMMLPSLAAAKRKAQRISTINNLKEIDLAKSMWASDNQKSPNDVPTENDLKPYLGGKLPPPVMGEGYVLGKVSEPAKAEVDVSQAKKSGFLASKLPSSTTKDEKVQWSADGGVTVVPNIGVVNQRVITVASTPPRPAPQQPVAGTPGTITVAVGAPQITLAPNAVADAAASAPEIVLPKAESVSTSDSFAMGNTGGAGGGELGGGRSGGYGGGGGAGGENTYVVKPGDTLTKIARAKGTTVQALEAENNLDSSKILIGQKMRLPSEAPAAAPGQQAPSLAWGSSETSQQASADTLVQDGKILYEAGKFAEANAKLNEALKKQPDNQAADYYKNLVNQAYYAREEHNRIVGAQDKMVQVAKEWTPATGVGLPVQNPATATASPVPGSTPAAVGFDDSSVNLNALNTPQNLGDESRQQASTFSFSGGATKDQNTAGLPAQARVEIDREKVPVVGDLPVAGHLFASGAGNVPVSTSNPSGAFPGFASVNSYDAATPAAMPAAPSASAGTFTFSSSTNAVALGGNYSNSLSRDDASGLRMLLSTNAVALDDSGVEQKKIQMLQADVNRLREELKIVDIDPNSLAPSPTLTQEMIQQLHSQQIEDEKRYKQLSVMLADLQALQQTNPAQLRDVLPTVTGDSNLSSLLNKLHETDQSHDKSSIAELNQQINDRVRGIMIALAAQTKSTKAALDEMTARVEFAKTNNYEEAKQGQPYWEAKRKLQNEIEFQKLAQARAVEAAKADQPLPKTTPNAPIPQPEVLARENAFSTFSLNVSDVSYKLAAASLERGRLPDAASIRSEEFINAFDYRDPEAAPGQPLAFASERARYPFAHNRDLLRFSVKTAAAGRQAGRALNLVLLLDTSGSMERADRVAIVREALRVLVTQLQPADTVSVVTFARTARLWADGVPGDKAGETLERVGGITPDGGTNLEEAMRLAYETAHRHYLAQGVNRVVLLTDGAANLGNVNPATLKQKVEAQRRQGIALDCFGIGWEDFDDNMLEQLSGNGDGRYAFINSPEEAGTEFAAKLAGALQVAAQDVKVQVEFNPQRVTSWRQIGYAKHQLTKEQFRDNSVIAAEIAAQEAGNALYTVETKPDGIGPIATVYVRYRIPGTQDVRERSWIVDYPGTAPALEQSSPAMRLAATASAFSEWLAASPFAQEVTPDELLKDLSGVPQIYGADQRPAKLETMIREAKSISGK